MTLRSVQAFLRWPALAVTSVGLVLSQAGTHAQSQLSRTGTIDALIGSHVKVTFDRSSVEFDAQAGSDALTPLRLRDRHDFRNPAVVDHDRGIRGRQRERHAAKRSGPGAALACGPAARPTRSKTAGPTRPESMV